MSDKDDELNSVFEEARRHLASLPDWLITSETRHEIARLSATARHKKDSLPGSTAGAPHLKIKSNVRSGFFALNRNRTLFAISI